MQRVFVLDQNKQPLMPCHPARARQLLKSGLAAVYRRYPFIICLRKRVGGDLQPLELRLDPGSQTTGLALVACFKSGTSPLQQAQEAPQDAASTGSGGASGDSSGGCWRLLWAANLAHRGQAIKAALAKRRTVRRSRRQRKTRYRPARFNNRRRPEGWLPPSLQSRVEQVLTWSRRLSRWAPIRQIAVETVRFDTQRLVNPEISGIQYQQGTLFGFETRAYLLEKWGRRCAYCGATGIPLQIDHIHPRSKGGSDRVSNLTLACVGCNQAKGDQPVERFLAHDPPRLAQLLAQTQRPLKDAAAVNTIRYVLGQRLKALALGPVSFWSGGRTKYNRLQAGYAKHHWIDATCVGEQPAFIPKGFVPLEIKAVGYGSRQVCLMDRYGFPRTRPKQTGRVRGFRTGDLVRAVVPSGKKVGVHRGRVAVRASGNFRIGAVDGINARYCRLLQRGDGYDYALLDSPIPT